MRSIRLHWVAPRMVACVVPVSSTPQLWPEEERAVVGSTLRRRLQYAAGREAARHAMIALGVPACAVGQGAEGEPLFPLELRGSISHTREYAVGLVGCAGAYRSLGVDIDDGRPLGDAAAEGVTWKSEVRRIQHAMRLVDRALAQNFAFSAKEAVFKCQYPLTFNGMLAPLQARLLQIPGCNGMAVAGWRVSIVTANVLARISVDRLLLDGHAVAVAVAKHGCT